MSKLLHGRMAACIANQAALTSKRTSILGFAIIVTSLCTLTITSFQVSLTQDSSSSAQKQSSPKNLQSMEEKFLRRLESRIPKLLPQCDELMSRPNSYFADGGFLSRRTTPHAWTPRADDSMQLDLTAICTLKRYTRDEARQCFADKHVTFVGDSLTRYQFISFVYFMERGNYPPRFPRETPCPHVDENGIPACSPPDQPNVCMEGDWKSLEGNPWSHFFSAIGGGEVHGTGIFNGRLQCRCTRQDPVIVDNELYVSEPDVHGNRTTLSYFKELGWDGRITNISGFDFTDCIRTGSCRNSMEDINETIKRAAANDYDFNQPFPDAIDPATGVLRKHFPTVDYAFYNRGLWGLLETARAERIFPMMYEWTGSGQGRCFFKGTTGSDRDTPRTREHEYRTIQNIAVKSGCSFVDLGHVTSEFAPLYFMRQRPRRQEGGAVFEGREHDLVYWDSVHYLPWVYEELNNFLLNVMCNNKGINRK